MPDLMVQIVRFVDNHQPGWVECEFVEAEGRSHLIIEKVPVVTAEDLDAESKYPKPGTVRCEILKRYRDKEGHELVFITTDRPFSIESTEGESEFTVLASLITSLENGRTTLEARPKSHISGFRTNQACRLFPSGP